MSNGQIVKIVSNDFSVLIGDDIIICKALGKFRYEKICPVVGDNVIVDITKKVIVSIKDRKNSLIRPVLANIDQCIIVCSVKNPDLDLFLLDKLLCILEFNKIKPIICFTKLDLLEGINYDNIFKYYGKYYDIYNNLDVSDLKLVFDNKLTVLTGQTGAGKSSLLNKLNADFSLNTGEISKALGRGKHTTRHVELFDLYGGKVADTPGFSSLDFNNMTKLDIRDNFMDFNDFRDCCKYKDCLHDLDDCCIIKSNSEILETRYENYIKFIRGVK